VPTQTPPYRVAILGCGWASSAHAAGYLAHPELFDVRICCDIDADNAATRSAQFPGSRTTSDWRAAVADPDVDVVDVCLLHNLHHPAVMAAAKAGKHVLLEKPLALTADEGREMARAVSDAGTTLMVAFNERHTWHGKTVRRLVDEGRIGDVYLVRTDHNQDTQFDAKPWWKSVEQVGGGALISSGIHMLDQLRWFGGDPVEVFCATQHLAGRHEAEAVAVVTARLPGGGVGTLDMSWAAPHQPWYQFLIVYGTKGRITTLGDDVTIATRDAVETIPRPDDLPEHDSFIGEVRHFGECLRDGIAPGTDIHDALRTQEFLDAAYRSAKENRLISVDYTG